MTAIARLTYYSKDDSLATKMTAIARLTYCNKDDSYNKTDIL
jgi:hypothetical protein